MSTYVVVPSLFSKGQRAGVAISQTRTVPSIPELNLSAVPPEADGTCRTLVTSENRDVTPVDVPDVDTAARVGAGDPRTALMNTAL